MARKSRDTRVALGGGESLERRSMLAVTASLSFGSLRIFLQANGDEATLTSDGTKYTVSGTGFSPTTFALSNVDSISALGFYGLTGLKFTVGSGSNIVDSLSILESIDTTIVNQAVVPDSGSISIGSKVSIALNADLTTVDAGISLSGPVTLGGTSADTRTLSAGGGDVSFGTTIDGASKLVVNSTGTTVLGGAIGSQTALAGVETNAGGATVIAGATVTTVGAAGQVFNDAVRLQANATFDAGTGPVTFASTVDGGMYLVTDTISVGQRPWFLALSADGTTGYVANEESDTVSVIDTNTRTVTATVGVGSKPFDIALSPDGSQVWTANRARPSSSVSVIDVATNTLIQTIATGNGTEFLAFSPDGSVVYASNYQSGTVSVIDTTTLTVVNTITVGTGPRQAVFSPDGTRAYVPDLRDGTVSVIRTSDGTVTDTITVGSTPYFAAMLPDGSKLYVPSYERSGNVAVIDTNPTSGTFNTVIATISTGSRSYPQYITISADGSRAYVVTDGYDEVAVINTATDTIVATPTAGNYPVYPALSPDGLSLYVSNISGDTLSVIDTATNTNVQEVAVGAAPYGVTVSPDSETIYVVNSDGASVSVIEVNPRFSLTVNSTGLTTFGGAVGGVRPLASVTTNAGGTTKIGGGLVRTTEIAGQSYGDAVELMATTVLQSDLAGPITFASTLDGAYPLEVIAGEGALLFKEAVGSVTPLAGLKITSASSTTGESTLALDGASKYANGLWLGPGVSNVSFANGGTIKNFTGNGIYAPDEGAVPLLLSTFDFGTDGWTVGNFLVPTPTPSDPDWVASGGNPGAFIRTTDGFPYTAFLAPSQFLGNWAADRVTGLTFNLRVSDSAAVNKATVVLSGGGISISKFGPYPTPNNTWVPYTLDLTSRSGWFYTNDGVTPGAAVSAADFATVLANVTALRINAEWSTAPGATVDLDNVVLLANLPNDNLTFRGLTVENNGGAGLYLDTATNVLFADGVIHGNGGAGVTATDGEDIAIRFSIIDNNSADGVLFTRSSGLIEGNEVFENGEDGIHVSGLGVDVGEDGFQVDVLGNIIRGNGDDGVDIRDGNFYGEDQHGDFGPSRIAGNTIELNSSNGVELSNVSGVLVGGEFPSDINFINLNGNAGVYATGIADAVVIGNEIDSNVNYGVEIDGGEDLTVGGPSAEAVNTIRRNGIAGVFAHGAAYGSEIFNNAISENPVGVMITSALGLQVGSRNFEGEQYGNHIFDNGEGIRATGDSFGTFVQGNLIEDNLTGATLASVRGLTFGYEDDGVSESGNIVRNNNEGLRGSGDLTDTSVVGNQFLDNTKVGIALESAKNLTVGCACGEDTNLISGSPVGLSASGTMTGTEVLYNQFSQNTVGISLSKATGMLVGGNTIDQSLKYGISVTGNNAGTQILDNTVTNTGDGPYLGSGIYLNGARNVDIIGNEVDGSSLAGLYATGNTSGTVVQGNLFTDNRIGMFLENATNAVFGGLGEDEGNTIVGGGDPLAGEYRDGILATGTLTGSSITGTDITDTSTGVWLRDARGIDINNTYVEGSKFYGFNATGDLSGSKFRDNLVTNTLGIGGGLGHAMHLENAQNLEVYDNIGEDSFGSGLYVTGDTTGTTVTSNLFDGNRVGISLINATNAAIGGLGEDDGNAVIGGSDAANGVYRDGIQVVGTSTGSSVIGTDVSDVTTGVTLENATGALVRLNEVTGAEFLGVNAQGTLTGTGLRDNTVTGSGGLGALGHGIYLANASDLSITGNSLVNSAGGGLYVTGTTTGTKVYDNVFEGNRVAIYLVNATNAVIGGLAPGEDNYIVGGGDASKGDFRDGILATGTLTGSSITAAEIIGAATGITLSSASGLMITSATVRESQVWGLNASGECVSGVVSSTFTLTAGGAGGGAGVLLSATQSFLIQDATISDNVIGLLATGNCTASAVRGTTWSGNTTGVINDSTGLPPLVIDPLP